jgi:intracellular multiplication protein IcmV
MAVKDIFKVSRKTFFNPSAWLGVNELTAYNRVIGDTLKTTFTPDKAQRKESFEQALKRLNLTEEDVQLRAKRYRLYSWIFAGFGLVLFLASFYYLFAYHTFAGWCLAMMSAVLFAANAFRFDFWYFQIKHRKLGCTFNEWWRGKPDDQEGASA